MTIEYRGVPITLQPREITFARKMYAESFMINGRIRLPYPQEIIALAAGSVQMGSESEEYKETMEKFRVLGLVV